MKLALVALPVVICISVAILETTSGQQFCWSQKKTRTGEDCEGKRRRFAPGMVRYVGANADAWAYTRHWTRINRASNSFCACPLPEHSGELHKQNISVRIHALFDRVGRSVPGYRPGVRWCCKCRKSADKLFKPEQEYSPPVKVT